MDKNSKIKLEQILKEAEKERIYLKHPYVGSEHLFLALIKDKNELSTYLKSYNLTYSSFRRELVSIVGSCTKDNPRNLYTPLLRKIIKRYENKNSNSYINMDINEQIFLSLLDEGEGIAVRIMLKMNVDLDEIYFNLKEKMQLSEMKVSNQIGIFLNNTVDLKEKVIGRDEELDKIIMTLTRKKKCNPVLIGPAGVGKTAIVEELARRIRLGTVPKELQNYKIFMIEMGSLISGTKYRGEFEERLNKIINEIITDKKTIIFIDEIHSMIGAGGAEGAINASDILKPYLARGDIKCIGATTTSEYNNSILKDKALARRFEVINIKEPSSDEMIELLNGVKGEYETFHDIKISKQIIKKITYFSDKYLKNISNPDKSIDLLDSACAYAKMHKNNNHLTEDDVMRAIYFKTNNYLINNKEFLENVKNNLSSHMSSKDILKICNSFHYSDSRPISILTSSDLVLDVIKNNLNLVNVININLNSYYFSLNNSLYADKTISDCLFTSIIDKPFSLIIINGVDEASKYILDEIEKINKDGYITLKYNEKIYFNNAIIIASVSKGKKMQTGFTSKEITCNLPKSFVESFTCNIKDTKVKEVSL